MAVTSLEIKTRQPLAGGRHFGSVGDYIQLDGMAHFAVDPIHPLNRCITDIELAPRDVDGLVHFSADIRSSLPKTLGAAISASCLMCRTVAIAWGWRRSTVSRDRSTQVLRPKQGTVS